ncbi:glycosyl transferase [Tenuifilaceae bacterium CYCD]|nr:glycosyl transferase [Tenuifilaceae bacterium CYCD]
MIRFFDLFISVVGLILLLPIFIVVYILIVTTSKGGAFFVQERVGKNGKPFNLIKFRSMRINQNNLSLLTVGKDPRITSVGMIIRKYKVDEFPQLINVMRGEMSIVGPRPEVKKYVELYSESQKKILSIRPGITDYASIKFINENEILSHSNNPEETYLSKILPIKIALSMDYVYNQNLKDYFKIIFLTILRILKNNE